MTFFISFLEGIITFISPCLLPMLPVYLSYFAGGEKSIRRTLLRALGFVGGFTAVFIAMGALSGKLGSFLVRYRTALDVACGGAVILFGLSFLGVLRIPIFRGGLRTRSAAPDSFLSAFLFGAVFSVSWTPCVGTFLGAALMLASREGSALTGMLMLLCYSAGLGIPFLLSAVLLDRLKNTFDLIKKHYKTVNTVCGILLIAVGVMMATGLFGRWIGLLA